VVKTPPDSLLVGWISAALPEPDLSGGNVMAELLAIKRRHRRMSL